jgi:hypothetical protein
MMMMMMMMMVVVVVVVVSSSYRSALFLQRNPITFFCAIWYQRFICLLNEHRNGVRLIQHFVKERWMKIVRCCYLPFLCKIRHYSKS